MPNEKEKKNVFKVAKVTKGVSHYAFKIPINDLEQLDIDGDKIHYILTDRVLQISGSDAAVTVPSLVLTEEAFVPKQ